MWRWTLILAALIALPTLAAPFSILSFQPDNHGGATAFLLVSNKVLTLPIDAAGVPHPERTVSVWNDAPQYPSFAAAPTASGYLMTFSDPVNIAWAKPLGADFSASALARPFGKGALTPLVCRDDRCAAYHNYFDINRQAQTSLLKIVDAAGTPIGEATVPNLEGIAALDDGGFAALGVTMSLVVTFVDGTGKVTATSTVATSETNFYNAAIAPHPLGAAVFWPDKSQIAAAIVRRDGAVVARAAFTAPDLEVFSVRAAHGGGQFGLEVTTVVEPGYYFPQSPDNRAPVLAANAMRVSESLNLLEAPVKLSPGNPSGSFGIVAGGDAFLGLFFDSAYRLLRIPFTGPIQPGSSTAIELPAAVRRRPARS